VPQVRGPVAFERFVRGAPEGLRLLAWTAATDAVWAVLESQPEARPASACLIVGPAGGLARREVELAREGGFVPVSLGPHVLRVETAAISLLAACVSWLDARGR
jgi:16S rRNA (uracil1498-N3)-methyltransferase